MKDETEGRMPIVVCPYSSFILPPSSFPLVSAKKLLNIRILSLTEHFISAAEDNLAFLHHHHFAIRQAQPFALTFKHHLSFFVYDRVFRTQVVEIVHLVRNKD